MRITDTAAAFAIASFPSETWRSAFWRSSGTTEQDLMEEALIARLIAEIVQLRPPIGADTDSDVFW